MNIIEHAITDLRSLRAIAEILRTQQKKRRVNYVIVYVDLATQMKIANELTAERAKNWNVGSRKGRFNEIRMWSKSKVVYVRDSGEKLLNP